MKKRASSRQIVFNSPSYVGGPRLAISESSLRRMIRDELAREYLVNEGFLDAIKEPFKRLGEKVKKEISIKADELLAKLQKAVQSLQSLDILGDIKKFRAAMDESGVSVDQIVSSVPEISKISKGFEDIKGVDIKQAMASETPVPQKESFYHGEFTRNSILLEEQFDQCIESISNSKKVLSEVTILAGIAAIAGTWWSVQTMVVGYLGLSVFVFKFLKWALGKMGLKGASKLCEKIEHFLHSVEDKWLEITAFPPPAQYAAYYAYTKMFKKEKPISYEEFNKKEKGKDSHGHDINVSSKEKEATFKILKLVIFIPMLVSAFMHFGQTIGHIFSSVSDAAHGALAGAKVGSKTMAAAGELGSIGGEIGSAAGEAGEAVRAGAKVVGAAAKFAKT